MTVVQQPVQRLRVYEEPNGSFATDNSGSMGSFLEVPAREGTMQLTLGREVLPVGHLQQHIDGMAEKVLGRKTWSLSFTVNLETFTTRAGDGVTAAQGALGRILKATMGGQNLGVGDTVNDASPSSNGFDVATAARWASGGAMGAATGAGGALEVRPIQSLSSSTVTLKQNYSSAVTNGADLYNAATYYLETGDGDVITTLQFAAEGLEQDDRWLLMGGQLESMAIEAGPSTVPSITFTIKGVDWDYADGNDTSGTLTGSTLGLSTYLNAKTLIVKDSELRCGTVGTATITSTLIDAPAYTFSPNLSYIEHFTPGGVENVKGWVRAHQPPAITGTIQRPFEGVGWKTDMESRVDKYVWLQIGTSVTDGAVVIDAPTVQITNWQRVDIGGIAGEEITWEARLDTDVGGAVTDIALSAFRIHLL